jgi:hypothetical protein
MLLVIRPRSATTEEVETWQDLFLATEKVGWR